MYRLGIAYKFLLGLGVANHLDDGIKGIVEFGGIPGVAGVRLFPGASPQKAEAKEEA